MDQVTSRGTSYDDDVYAWAFEQAAALRRLAAARPGLSEELDIENIAEEIEDVGHSQLDRAESFLRLLLLHLVKLASVPQARVAEHWIAEIRVFHLSFTRGLTRSIINKIEVDEIWLLARDQAIAQLKLESDPVLPGLPPTCPVQLDLLARRPLDLDAATRAIRQSATGGQPSP